MAHKIVGSDLMVLVGGNSAWAAEDYELYLHDLEALAHALRTSDARLRSLIFADEGDPTAKQRVAVAKLLRGVKTRAAVLTDSKIAQYVTTAFSWLDLPMRAFGPTNFSEATAHLELKPRETLQALAAARVLAISIGSSKSVELAVQSCAEAQR